MTVPDIVLRIIVFLSFAGLTVFVCRRMEKRVKVRHILSRLDRDDRIGRKPPVSRHFKSLILKWVRPLGSAAAPRKEKERHRVVNALKQAGYHGKILSSLEVYFGIRVLLAVLFGVLCFGWLLVSGSSGSSALMKIFLLFGAGYYLPAAILKYRSSRRSRRIWQEIPDVLDLLRICAEAGLGLDRALDRVGRELKGIAPVLSAEFSRYFFEIRSGLPKRTALANLAERNQVGALSAVVNLLVQSNRLGTDISEALRIHSLSLRTERIQGAEEQGAKVSVKLVFPLVFFILPPLLIVIVGPAIVNLLDRLSKLS